MYQQIIFSDAVLTNCHDFRMSAVHPNAFLTVLAEDHGLAMLEIEHAIGANSAFGEIVKRAIVEDVAVLIDLDKRHALVFRGSFHDPAEMFDVDIDRARHEGRLTRYRQ